MEQYYKELIHSKSDATTHVATIETRTQELYEENCKLNELVSKCQQKSHKFGLEVKFFKEKQF